MFLDEGVGSFDTHEETWECSSELAITFQSLDLEQVEILPQCILWLGPGVGDPLISTGTGGIVLQGYRKSMVQGHTRVHNYTCQRIIISQWSTCHNIA